MNDAPKEGVEYPNKYVHREAAVFGQLRLVSQRGVGMHLEVR